MKIGLQNFQGVGAYTEISIAPITLFYGQNSAGKSSIADAIKFLRGTLENSHSGENWSKELKRHARRKLKDTYLKEGDYKGEESDVIFTIKDIFSEDDLYDPEHNRSDHFIFGVDDGFTNANFEYQLFFSSTGIIGRSWRLRESMLLVDEIPFFRYKETIYGRSVSFNSIHPSFTSKWNWGDELRSNLVSLIEEQVVDDLVIGGGGIKTNSVSWFELNYPASGDRYTHSRLFEFNPSFDAMVSGMPASIEGICALNGIKYFLDLPATVIARNLRIAAIGPIRDLPNMEYKVDPLYAEGGECWKELVDDIYRKNFETKGSENLGVHYSALNFVNHFLSSPDLLDTGYTITGDVKIVMNLKNAGKLSNLNHQELMKSLEPEGGLVHPYLVYQSSDLPVEIVDVGVGISQLIPVIWACWTTSSLTHVQQPELHLHPRLQGQVADLFINALHKSRKMLNPSDANGLTNHLRPAANARWTFQAPPENFRYFLLESHSEHILLRLLRRVRETKKIKFGDVYPEDGSELENHYSFIENAARLHLLHSSEVSVVYVDKNKEGLTTMKQLRLTEDGEFIDRWPGGFFSERDVDLFGDDLESL